VTGDGRITMVTMTAVTGDAAQCHVGWRPSISVTVAQQLPAASRAGHAHRNSAGDHGAGRSKRAIRRARHGGDDASTASPAIAAAIHDVTGAWLTQQPMTPERVLAALSDE
jgi:hypothetical protein